jgi:hypothetical protein
LKKDEFALADLVKRLRETWGPRDFAVTDLCKEAADEIDRLRSLLANSVPIAGKRVYLEPTGQVFNTPHEN